MAVGFLFRIKWITKSTMFEFCTKANTLERVRPLLKESLVPDSFAFKVSEWNTDPEGVIETVCQELSCDRVIVRSSAIGEDSYNNSMAGMYESVPNVILTDKKSFSSAVEEVIDSYSKDGFSNDDDQVLVQPMLTDISMSGVVFTQDLNSGAPYYTINYDDISGRFDSITSGKGDTNRTLVVRHGYSSGIRSSRFQKLLKAIHEIEAVTSCSGLDIEFFVDSEETIFIVQIRPLAVSQNWNRGVTKSINRALEQIKSFVIDRMRPIYGANGHRTILGIMPDWNPVEMLGAAPRRLASSLYEFLITRSVWAEARADMGYRDMSQRPLMHSLGGRMYIDVRESFNSFLPAGLGYDLSEKIVNQWLDRLGEHPELHDKVEFEVAVTTHTPDFHSHVAPKLLGELSADELAQFEVALKKTTASIIGDEPSLVHASLDKIEKLTKMEGVFDEPLSSSQSRLLLVQQILDDCKENGTRPFSVIARCAFIAESMLRGLVNVGCFDEARASTFRASIRTVLSDFLNDLHKLRADEIDEATFMSQYGHLRPSSYDILSLRYDQRVMPSHSMGGRSSKCMVEEMFSLSSEENDRINAVLEEQEYGFNAATLFEFMEKAITGREYAKFKFTKHLSDSIELIARWGEGLGLTRDELAHLDIRDILDCSCKVAYSVPLEESLREISLSNAQKFEITQALKLPFLLVDPLDIDIIPLLKSRPNFITTNSVQTGVVFLTGRELQLPDLRNKIVLIEGADPGFDWIFAHSIAGLITKHGGANSHMAIRCAEMDLPAAIGCGDQLFSQFCKTSELRLDCGSEHITVL